MELLQIEWYNNSKTRNVFVFHSAWNKDYILVKRCLGLPGDTLSIKKGEVYTNSIRFNSPETIKNNCNFRIKNKNRLYKSLDSLSIKGYISYNNKKRNFASAMFSKQEFELLQNKNCIDSINKNIEVYNPQEKLLKISTSQWTLDDMGPMIIPKSGMKIQLNPDSFMLYEKVIRLFEKSTMADINGTYFIHGKRATSYTFRLNYYFMMGDNRKGTHDSRRWGLLPETNIIGKVQCVLFSNKNGMLQWDRLFKVL